MRWTAVFAALTVMASDMAGAVAPLTSPRPPARDEGATLTSAQATANLGFQRWTEGFRARALEAGIAPVVFDGAFAGIRYNTDVVQRDRNQSEFTKQIWDYLDSAASDTRVRNGRAALADNAPLLDAIEARYGVEKEVVVAVWGLESAYGSFRGTTPIIEALATLAYDGRRGAFFEQQLLAALNILQAGDVAPANMTGSISTAMGAAISGPTTPLMRWPLQRPI